jgi:hypothetical protein
MSLNHNREKNFGNEAAHLFREISNKILKISLKNKQTNEHEHTKDENYYDNQACRLTRANVGEKTNKFYAHPNMELGV